MTYESVRQEWVYCPVCGNKTRLRLRKDTVLINFPLFCPKCKKESLINAKEYMIRKINKTQLCKAAGITTNAMAKLGRDETVTQETLEKYVRCSVCTLDDIVEIKTG